MTPLRIAVDARELAGHVTGVGTYLLHLLGEWAPRQDVALRLVAHRDLSPAVGAIPGFDRLSIDIHPDATGGTIWEQRVLPRTDAVRSADVLFAPAYTAPLFTRVPTTLVVHDVSFLAHPEWFRPREGLRRRVLTRRAVKRAARVLTVSDFSAAEISRYCGIPRERLDVIPHGAPARQATSRNDRDPLVVYVGSIFNRRHIPDLIAAFARIARKRPAARLLLAGANRTWPPEDIRSAIAASGVADRISWREDASSAEITAALGRASASAFLSEYEGFALTPFEALACGVPSVLADTPVAREVYGDAALYAPVGDIDAAAKALALLLDSAETRHDLLTRAEPLFTRHTWREAADATLTVLREAAQ